MDTSKLTRAEMRVRIAKDVLKLIRPIKKENAKRPELVITEGTYFLLEGVNKDTNPDDEGGDVELQTLLKGRSCEVCALGALFAAEVWRNDKLKVFVDGPEFSVEVDRADMVKRLGKFFSKTDMDRIENWFEASSINDTDKQIEEDIVYTAGEMYNTGEDRLKLLLKFIVKNDGHLNWKNFLKEVNV